MSAVFIQVHFRLIFFIEANNMNPDQTAPREQSYLSSYCLQYGYRRTLTKEEQTTKVVTIRLRVNID